MIFLKAGFPGNNHPKLIRVTDSNLFTMCSICGEEVHLSAKSVSRNIGSLIADQYICPQCSMALMQTMTAEDNDPDIPDSCDDCPDYETCTYNTPSKDERKDEHDVHDVEEYEPDEAADDERKKLGDHEPDATEGGDAKKLRINEMLAEMLLEGLIIPLLRQ